ncbi:MAG TPA: hypothetical protein VFJ47_12155 [Terriglobales bacterium]|nr:hypothetical protein [Terriglobales bacterium]
MKFRKSFSILFLLLGVCYGRAIAQALPEGPSWHRYWDRENKVLFIAHAGVTTADFIITHQNLSNGGHETNPLAKPLCESGTPGQVVFFGGRVLSTLSVSYALHRTGHHKMERGVTMFMIGDSAYGVSYSLAHR